MIDISTLNPAQLEAVTAPDGPVLVIAGAGSGKTRTIVHRLAWLAEQGIPASDMLLLTFTRKSQTKFLRVSIVFHDTISRNRTVDEFTGVLRIARSTPT